MPTPMMSRFVRIMQYYTSDETLAVTAFAAGFVTGQAEKVAAGACTAAMFRPDRDDRDELLAEIVARVADSFGLFHGRFVFEGQIEYWVARAKNWAQVDDLASRMCRVNSPEWHLYRAGLCGIEVVLIDLEYHKSTE